VGKRYKVAEIAEIYNVSRASVNRAIEKANKKLILSLSLYIMVEIQKQLQS